MNPLLAAKFLGGGAEPGGGGLPAITGGPAGPSHAIGGSSPVAIDAGAFVVGGSGGAAATAAPAGLQFLPVGGPAPWLLWLAAGGALLLLLLRR